MHKRKKSPLKPKNLIVNSTLSEIVRNIQPTTSYKNYHKNKDQDDSLQCAHDEQYVFHQKKFIMLKKIDRKGEKDSQFTKKQNVIGAQILHQFKNYVVYDQLLGEGAFSKVFLGINKHTKNRVAVKQVQKLQQNEVACLMHLESPYIIKMHQLIEHKAYSYIVLQLCQVNFKDQLTRCSVAEGINYFQQIIQGMSHLNKKNIIHRDLKFENILIKDGKIKISDFGFAKPIGQKMSVYSVKCGTPYTMAPQIYFHSGMGKPVYTHKCDIWSLGIMLHQILYQIHPFDYSVQKFRQKKRLQVIKKHGYLDILIDKCLEFQPKNRCNWNQFQQIFSLYKIKKSQNAFHEMVENQNENQSINNKQNQMLKQKQKEKKIQTKKVPKKDFLLRYKKLNKYQTPQQNQIPENMKFQGNQVNNAIIEKKMWDPFMEVNLKSIKQQVKPVNMYPLPLQKSQKLQMPMPERRQRRISCRQKPSLSFEEVKKKQQLENEKAVSLVKLVTFVLILIMFLTLGEHQLKNLRV